MACTPSSQLKALTGKALHAGLPLASKLVEVPVYSNPWLGYIDKYCMTLITE